MTIRLPKPVSADSPRRFPGVQLKGMLFTLVEPRRELAREYNRWYEGDHFYATVVGPGVLSGRRFASTRTLKDLRIMGEDPIVPTVDTGSFLALYLLSNPTEFSEWGAVNTGRLHEAGRIFEEREHVHTLMYAFEWSSTVDPSGVSPEQALEHPFELVVAEFVTARPGGGNDLSPWMANRYAPRVHAETGAHLILSFRPVPLLDEAPRDVPRAARMDETYLHLHFHRRASADNVMAGLRRAGQYLQESGRATMRFASPFIPTVPGTDRHVDDLW